MEIPETPYQQFPEQTVKSSRVLTSSLTIIVFLIAGYALIAKLGGLWPFEEQMGTTVCTQDAKLCPDGSYVGRTGPNCEFSDCPNTTSGEKTYTNTQFGYSLVYPTAVSVTTINGEARLVGPLAAQQSPGETGVSAVLYASTTTATIPSYPTCAQHRSTTTVGTFTAIRFDGCDLGNPLMIQWITNHTLFVATIHIDNDLMINVLSTFKLTNDATGWKTLTDPKYEMKYPQALTPIATSQGLRVEFRQYCTTEKYNQYFGIELVTPTQFQKFIGTPRENSDFARNAHYVATQFRDYGGNFQGCPELAPLSVTLDEILSTFKFTDATAGWKTYTNKDGIAFTIKYPQEWAQKNITGNFGEKIFTLDSGAAKVGGVQVMWNSQYISSSSPCPAGTTSEFIQIKDQKVAMCYSSGSSQEPAGYQYSSTQNNIKYSINSSHYPGAQNKAIILQILSTLDISQ